MGAAMAQIGMAFEDAFLPAANQMRPGRVYMEEKAPDDYGFAGRDGGTLTPVPRRFVTMPGFAEKYTYTGNVYSAGAGNPRDGASAQAARVLGKITSYAIQPAAIAVSSPLVTALAVVDVISSINDFAMGTDTQQLNAVGAFAAGYIPGSVLVKAGRQIYLEGVEDLWVEK
jgi:hypothetical protein